MASSCRYSGAGRQQEGANIERTATRALASPSVSSDAWRDVTDPIRPPKQPYFPPSIPPPPPSLPRSATPLSRTTPRLPPRLSLPVIYFHLFQPSDLSPAFVSFDLVALRYERGSEPRILLPLKMIFASSKLLGFFVVVTKRLDTHDRSRRIIQVVPNERYWNYKWDVVLKKNLNFSLCKVSSM